MDIDKIQDHLNSEAELSMARSHDGESETGHEGRNIHRKRVREMNWRPEASQELLRLRFREFRTLFDNAQTVADVHEAWGVVASTLNDVEGLELQVDAVKCSDQLTKLRQQWQDSSRTQLQLMMTQCFSPQQREQTRSNFNRAMGEAMVTPPKRQKTTEKTMEPDAASDKEAPLSPGPPEPASVSPDAASPDRQEDSSPCQDEAPAPPEPVSDVDQEATSSFQEQTVEEFPRQDEIMDALEKRSEQLERLAKSHQYLADVTQELMEALINRQGMAS